MIPMQDCSDFEINIDMEEEEEGIICTQDLPMEPCLEAPEILVQSEESEISLHED